jgi:hypothetical protein
VHSESDFPNLSDLARQVELPTRTDLLSLRPLADTLAAVCQDACTYLGADVTHVALVDSSGGHVTIHASCGTQDERWTDLSMAFGEGQCGRCAQDQRIYTGGYDAETTDEPERVRLIAHDEGIQSSMFIPLETAGELVGVLWLCFQEPVRHSREALRRIRPFADAAATAITNAKLFERVSWDAKAGQKLFALLRSTPDPPSFARFVSELADNPVAIYNRQFDLIACHPPNLSALLESEVVELRDEIERGARPELADHFATLEEAKRGVLVPEDRGWDWPFDRAQAPAILGDDLLGFVEIIGIHSPLGEDDVRLAESAGTAFALQLFVEKVSSEAEHRLRGELLDDLLSGNREGIEAAVRRLSHLQQHLLTGPYLAMVCEVPDLTSLASSRGWSAYQAVRTTEALRENVSQVCSDLKLRALVVQRDSKVVAVLPTPVGGEAASFRDLGHIALARLRALSPSVPLRICIGSQVDDVRMIRRSCDDAILALRVSENCGIANDVLYAEDLGILTLLSNGTDPGRLDRFVEMRIGRLIEYDRENSTDLVKTLAAYLDHYRNKTTTARSLNVHINTLKYRLKRINEACSIDCEGDADIFPIHLALHVHRTIGMLSPDE